MAQAMPSRRCRHLRRQLAQAPGLPFADLLPARRVEQALRAEGVSFRERLFSPLVTLWAFLSQVLDPDHSCRAAVARFLAWRAARGLAPCSADTGAYCKARSRLPEPVLARLARDPDAPAPLKVPEAITDGSRPAFFRTNLALAYGRALTGRKVYEEALEVLLTVKPEEVSDPAAYFFHKAVCEHALMMKDRADGSIDRLLVDVTDGPERYRMVAALMHFDMLTWQEKDLGWVARKMENVQRRLDLKRGGKVTQKMQKEVAVRLEEMIKEIENQQKKPGGA